MWLMGRKDYTMRQPSATMPDVGSEARGPDKSKSLKEVVDSLETALAQTDAPAVTLNAVTEVSDYSRQTVNDRLADAKEEPAKELDDRSVRSAKVGGANAYWIENKAQDPTPAASGGGGGGHRGREPTKRTDGGSVVNPNLENIGPWDWVKGITFILFALPVLHLQVWLEDAAARINAANPTPRDFAVFGVYVAGLSAPLLLALHLAGAPLILEFVWAAGIVAVGSVALAGALGASLALAEGAIRALDFGIRKADDLKARVLGP